jgi:hypothetical protein
MPGSAGPAYSGVSFGSEGASSGSEDGSSGSEE